MMCVMWADERRCCCAMLPTPLATNERTQSHGGGSGGARAFCVGKRVQNKRVVVVAEQSSCSRVFGCFVVAMVVMVMRLVRIRKQNQKERTRVSNAAPQNTVRCRVRECEMCMALRALLGQHRREKLTMFAHHSPVFYKPTLKSLAGMMPTSKRYPSKILTPPKRNQPVAKRLLGTIHVVATTERTQIETMHHHITFGVLCIGTSFALCSHV